MAYFEPKSLFAATISLIANTMFLVFAVSQLQSAATTGDARDLLWIGFMLPSAAEGCLNAVQVMHTMFGEYMTVQVLPWQLSEDRYESRGFVEILCRLKIEEYTRAAGIRMRRNDTLGKFCTERWFLTRDDWKVVLCMSHDGRLFVPWWGRVLLPLRQVTVEWYAKKEMFYISARFCSIKVFDKFIDHVANMATKLGSRVDAANERFFVPPVGPQIEATELLPILDFGGSDDTTATTIDGGYPSVLHRRWRSAPLPQTQAPSPMAASSRTT